MRGKYRGCTGGIRSINCHPTRNVFAAVGLDRFLRIFDIYKAKPIQKFSNKSHPCQNFANKSYHVKKITPKSHSCQRVANKSHSCQKVLFNRSKTDELG